MSPMFVSQVEYQYFGNIEKTFLHRRKKKTEQPKRKTMSCERVFILTCNQWSFFTYIFFLKSALYLFSFRKCMVPFKCGSQCVHNVKNHLISEPRWTRLKYMHACFVEKAAAFFWSQPHGPDRSVTEASRLTIASSKKTTPHRTAVVDN